MAADTIAAGEGATLRVNGTAGCQLVELATAAVRPCPAAATVTFDPASHVLATVGADGVHHTAVLPANIRDDNFLGVEPVLQISPDGRAFVLGIGRFMDQVTVIGDIELAHVTTLPSQLLAVRFLSNDHAFVVTRNGVLDVTPHERIRSTSAIAGSSSPPRTSAPMRGGRSSPADTTSRCGTSAVQSVAAVEHAAR